MTTRKNVAVSSLTERAAKPVTVHYEPARGESRAPAAVRRIERARTKAVPAEPQSVEPPRDSWLIRLARRAVRSRLSQLQNGQIVISDNGDVRSFGAVTERFPMTVTIDVKDPRFYADIAFGGTIGSGESFMRDYWACAELTALIRILVANRHVLLDIDSGLSRLGKPLIKLLHRLNRNSRNGSRRNIAAHYDLGNDFYRLWLDPKMMYSAAWFATPDTSLEEASAAKLDRICRKLDLGSDDHVLEIGTGWGGFAIFAAQHYGCRVTTTTISKEQHAWAESAIRNAGLADRITLLQTDYRDLEGQYDKLVSIEMIEAVGHAYQATFHRKCCELLKPDGLMLLQGITIADQNYASYRNSVDFINRYIFPGGCLISLTETAAMLTRHTDMRIVDVEDIGPHYATTLQHWRERFLARLSEVRELGYPDSFIRMWLFYLSYCEGAFLERAIGDVQLLIMRPDARFDVTI